MNVVRVLVTAVTGFSLSGAIAAQPAAQTPSMQSPSAEAAPTKKAFCDSLALKAPASARKKDGVYDVGKVTTPKGALLYRGQVTQGQVTDAWPLYKGKRLKEKKGGTPKEIAACAKEQGAPVASTNLLRQVLDLLVADADARWCGSPRSYTQCTGDFLCTTCVFSGRKMCGCYSF